MKNEPKKNTKASMDDVATKAKSAIDDLTAKAKRAGAKIARATEGALTSIGHKVEDGGASAAKRVGRVARKLEATPRPPPGRRAGA